MKNKKRIIILSVILTIIVVALLVGYLYFATDVFKTKQQLFYKYLSKIEIFDIDFLEQVNAANNKIAKTSNSSSGTIEVSTSIADTETGVANVQEIATIATNGLENSLTEQSYKDFTISNSGQDLLTLKYMKDGNIYGIGADNILAKYISVENNNLKDLASKLGIENTTNIPNSIPTNINEILKIDETTLKSLSNTYLTLIYDKIDASHYYKTVNSDGTENIGISLTEKEIEQLIVYILETAKNDTVLLNLIVNKANLLGISEITIESLQTKIQECIDGLLPDLTTPTTVENNEYNDNIIMLELIKKDKKIIGVNLKTEYIKQRDAYDVVTDDTSNSIQEKTIDVLLVDFSTDNNIKMSVKENDTEVANLDMNYIYDNNNINITITTETIEDDEKQTIKVQCQTNNIQTDNVSQNMVVNINSNDEENYQVKYTNNITFKQDVIISKLTTENSAKLNDMTSEEIGQLITALCNRINQLFGINTLGM